MTTGRGVAKSGRAAPDLAGAREGRSQRSITRPRNSTIPHVVLERRTPAACRRQTTRSPGCGGRRRGSASTGREVRRRAAAPRCWTAWHTPAHGRPASIAGAAGLRGSGSVRLDEHADRSQTAITGRRSSSSDTRRAFVHPAMARLEREHVGELHRFAPWRGTVHTDWTPLSRDRKIACMPSGVTVTRPAAEEPTSTAPRPSRSAARSPGGRSGLSKHDGLSVRRRRWRVRVANQFHRARFTPAQRPDGGEVVRRGQHRVQQRLSHPREVLADERARRNQVDRFSDAPPGRRCRLGNPIGQRPGTGGPR